jgi:hypothetical protein
MKSVRLILAVMFLAGCGGVGLNIDDSDSTRILAGIAARNIGCEVKRSGEAEVDRTLRNIYLSVRAGEPTTDALVQLAQLTKGRPTLAADVADLLALVGLKLNSKGETVISYVPVAIFEQIEKSYVQGYALCQGEI